MYSQPVALPARTLLLTAFFILASCMAPASNGHGPFSGIAGVPAAHAQPQEEEPEDTGPRSPSFGKHKILEVQRRTIQPRNTPQSKKGTIKTAPSLPSYTEQDEKGKSKGTVKTAPSPRTYEGNRKAKPRRTLPGVSYLTASECRDLGGKIVKDQDNCPYVEHTEDKAGRWECQFPDRSVAHCIDEASQ